MPNSTTSKTVATGSAREDVRVAIASLGSVGLKVARELDRGVPGYRLVAVSARSPEAAAERMKDFETRPPVLPVAELEPLADMIVECAPAPLFNDIVAPFVTAGKTAIVLSAGALLSNEHLVDVAARHNGRIIIPSGALLGLDAVVAAAEGRIESVRMVTRKPVRGLLGAEHLEKNGIVLEGITEPVKVYDGNAREAAVGFPANLNVAVALSLAGIGPDETKLEIWADPDLTRNTHTIKVVSDSAGFEMKIENIPSENPKTGRITAQSVLAVLRKMNSPLSVGT